MVLSNSTTSKFGFTLSPIFAVIPLIFTLPDFISSSAFLLEAIPQLAKYF